MLRRGLILLVLAGSSMAQSVPSTPAEATATNGIAGMLVDSVSGKHIIGGKVTLTPFARQNDTVDTITDEEGHFVFSGLGSGKYAIYAQKHGYLTQAFEAHQGYYTGIVVGENKDSTHLVFSISPECGISGTVLDEAGEPVREAMATLYQTTVTGGMERARKRAEIKTNDLGVYRFSYLAPGKYFVLVSSQVWYAQRPLRKTQENVTLFTNVAGGAGSSTVFGGGDLPEIPDISSPLDVSYPLTFFPGTSDPLSATPIQLKAGENSIADIHLQPEPALRVTLPGLREADKEPIFNQNLAPGISIPIPVEVRVSQSGEMAAVGILPGQYVMKWWQNGQAENDTSQVVDIQSSGQVKAQESLGAQVSVSLQQKLLPSSRNPYLRLNSKTTNEFFDEPIPDNGEVKFKQLIPAGSYELAFWTSSGQYIESISGTGVSGRTIEIKQGQPVRLKLFLDEGRVQVSGTVLYQDQARGAAVVLLVPEDFGNNKVLLRRDQSNSDGSFALSNAIPGKYTLLAIERGWELDLSDPAVLQPFIGKGVPIDLRRGKNYDLKINLQLLNDAP